jgi:hypothetical protein
MNRIKKTNRIDSLDGKRQQKKERLDKDKTEMINAD